MSIYSAVASFALLAGLLTIIPGLDTALVVRTALAAGRLRGFATALGITAGTFYLAMLPQFVPPHAPHLLMGLLLAGVHDVEGMTWFALLIGLVHRARGWLDRGAARRAVDRLTGAVLIGFGLRLALPQR